jgi:membrane-bound metal-dependent hydrolase YbcI (DUF457 family)
VSRRAVALASLATVVAADWTIHRRRPRWLLVGLLDVPAHVGTGALVLANLPARSGHWTGGFLAGSVLPDLDHVPLVLSRVHPDIDDPRPVTHCLLALAPLPLVAAALRGGARDWCLGAAAGGLAHFARDLAVGTGVALLRPLDRRSRKLPYPVYAAVLVALAARAAWRSGCGERAGARCAWPDPAKCGHKR